MINSTQIKPDQPTREIITKIGGTVPNKSVPLAAVLRQPELSITDMIHFKPEIENYADDIIAEAETQIKYEGYLVRQQELVDKFRKMESVSLPEDIDYSAVAGLTREAVEKLTEVRPLTLGQASRISGITPAAVSSIEIHLKKSAPFNYQTC